MCCLEPKARVFSSDLQLVYTFLDVYHLNDQVPAAGRSAHIPPPWTQFDAFVNPSVMAAPSAPSMSLFDLLPNEPPSARLSISSSQRERVQSHPKPVQESLFTDEVGGTGGGEWGEHRCCYILWRKIKIHNLFTFSKKLNNKTTRSTET